MKQTLFWLEFIKALDIKCDKNKLESLMKEADELVAIFSSGIRTLKTKNPALLKL